MDLELLSSGADCPTLAGRIAIQASLEFGTVPAVSVRLFGPYGRA
jgi:hypothetical protein